MYKPTLIELPTPKMGGKCWLLESKGLFVLQGGPGVLRTIACTHAGTGSLAVYDGIPNEDGFFPDEEMPESHPDFMLRNGRVIYRATPVVMGSWMLDAGFHHGVTVLAKGGVESAAAIASIVWMPYQAREKKPEAAPDVKKDN